MWGRPTDAMNSAGLWGDASEDSTIWEEAIGDIDGRATKLAKAQKKGTTCEKG